jgi:hypothetical protein
MWYFVLYLAFAVWVFTDAKKRLNHPVGWPAATLVLGPVVLPVYFAKRNLQAGEVREGGTGWNVIKNFALFWTLTVAAGVMAGMVNAGQVADRATTQAQKAGAALGASLGMGMIFVLWFVVLAAALILGLFLKKSSIVEHGPTGPLAQATTVE